MYCDGCSVARDDLDMPEDYTAAIEGHKRRADAMEAARDNIRNTLTSEVNRRIAEFVEDWKSPNK